MILTRVEIENYKQYVGTHDIEFPQDALVGIIGDNGTGKTTLFEAIEWCLYSPRSISPGDVRPRGLTGNTTVRVYLETADGTDQFVVQRLLRKTPSAAIYRIDPSGEMQKIVDGTRQVSEYVATTLIGLSHTAFTATFFTRQKDLHLFGNETPGKRREAIGRMLGLETIRQARRSIMDDRQAALADARAIRTQYERESMGRDFEQELAITKEAIVARETDVTESTGVIAATAHALATAEGSLATAQERRDRHSLLAREIALRDREHGSCSARIAQIQAELAQVAQRETERSKLAAIADTFPELKAKLEHQEAERERFERKTGLERSRSDIVSRRRDAIDGIAHHVSGISPREPVEGWSWNHDDDIAPSSGVGRLVAVIDNLNVDAAEHHETSLRTCLDTAQAVVEAERVLNRYEDRRNELLAQLKACLANGEPEHQLAQLDRERELLLARKTTLEADANRLEIDRDRARLLLQNLRQQQFGDLCPTCGRPFAAGDAEIVIAAMESRIDGLGTSIASTSEEIMDASRGLVQIEDQRTAIASTQKELDKLRSSIENGEGYIREQETQVRHLRDARETAYHLAGLTAAPSPEAIHRAQVRVRDLQAIARTRKALVRVAQELESLRDQETTTIEQLEPLQDVTFDPAGFARLQGETHAADRARAEVAQIDRELSRRPALQTDLVTHQSRVKALTGEIASFEQERVALHFEPGEVDTAQHVVNAARSTSQQAQDRYHALRAQLREAELLRDQVIKERDRLQDLAALSDRRQREADEFDLMSREFMEFERFAGERKVPILNDTTSSLVDAITDGKFQRVEFDQDFGIRVFDSGEIEESYPIDTFSGGERDAIILAARLALSRMIGQQAVNPPGFLVLDEVFGSLDADRRAQLLGLLGTVTTMFDDIRQVFIISHVDDVRTSSVLDEVWRVEETADGGSRVIPLASGTDI